MNWCDTCGQTVRWVVVTWHRLPLPGQAGRFIYHTYCPECRTRLRSDVQ